MGFNWVTFCHKFGSISIVKNTPPKYTIGVRINDGNHIMSSKVLENIEFTIPATEKKKDIRKIMQIHIINECILNVIKNSVVISTIKPLSIPLKIPPNVYPMIIIQVGKGESKSSSIFF